MSTDTFSLAIDFLSVIGDGYPTYTHDEAIGNSPGCISDQKKVHCPHYGEKY